MSRQVFKPFCKVLDLSGSGKQHRVYLNGSDNTGAAFSGVSKTFNYLSIEASGADTDNYFFVQPVGPPTTTTQLGASGAGHAPASGCMWLTRYEQEAGLETSGFCGTATTTNKGTVEFLLGQDEAMRAVDISLAFGDRTRFFLTYGNIRHTNPLRDNDTPAGL